MSKGGTAGGIAAGIAGVLMIALSAYGGGLAASLPAIVGLTVPLVAAGIVYGRLVEDGRIRPGFGPGIIFWAVAFATARTAQELLLGVVAESSAIQDGLAGFVVYQTMVGSAFGLGIVLLHSQIAGLMGVVFHPPRASDASRDGTVGGGSSEGRIS